MFRELFCAFFFYDRKALNHKILKLWKAPNESIVQFYDLFCHYYFEFPKYEVDWKFLTERFQYLVHISENPHELESFKPLPTYLGVRAFKSKMNKVAIPSDPPSPCHKTSLALWYKVGEVSNLLVELSPSPPTPPALDFCVELDYKLNGCQVVSSA